jgi:hypothetical protein
VEGSGARAPEKQARDRTYLLVLAEVVAPVRYAGGLAWCDGIGDESYGEEKI